MAHRPATPAGCQLLPHRAAIACLAAGKARVVAGEILRKGYQLFSGLASGCSHHKTFGADGEIRDSEKRSSLVRKKALATFLGGRGQKASLSAYPWHRVTGPKA